MKLLALLLILCFTVTTTAMKNNELVAMARQNQRSHNRDIVAGGVLAAGVAASKCVRYLYPDQSTWISILPMAPGALFMAYNLVEDYFIRNGTNTVEPEVETDTMDLLYEMDEDHY